MGLYDAMKDAVNLAQKADNIDLYRQLLDLSAQALELQAEIARLTAENEELRKTKDIESRIIRHTVPYITLEDDNDDIYYCATCWGSQKKLIQVQRYDEKFVCPVCNTNGRYGNKRRTQWVY